MPRKMPLAVAVVACLVLPTAGAAVRGETETIEALALRIAGSTGSVEQRTARLVAWTNTEFRWTETDYQQRTAEEIIERRGGNCAELARVVARLLDATHIGYRYVREINVQPASDTRQANAEKKIASGGNRFSVFGLRHNDHTWLEVFDPASGTWIPADPAVGVVGIDQWIAARLKFEQRREPAVAAAMPVVKAMLVPVAVVAIGPAGEDRTSYYLVEAFDRAYGGRLHTLPAWSNWADAVRQLGPLSAAAFAGQVNLHEHASLIAQAAAAYDSLRGQV